MLCLLPLSGKTEHFTKSNGSSLQTPSTGLSNGALHSSVAASILKLRMLKDACLQGQNMMGKKRLSYGLLKHTVRKCSRHCTSFP